MANILAMKNLIDLANRMKAGKNINIKDLGCTIKSKTSNPNAIFTIGTNYPETSKIITGFNPKKPNTLYGIYLFVSDEFGNRNAVIEFADGTSQAEAGELLTEIMEDRRYVRLTKNKFKSTAKGVKGKTLPLIPSIHKSEMAATVDIGKTKDYYIKKGFTSTLDTLSMSIDTKEYETKQFYRNPDPNKNGWLEYNPIISQGVDPSEIVTCLVGETKFLDVTTLEQVDEIGQDSFIEEFFNYRPIATWHNKNPRYTIFHVEEDMLNHRSVPYNQGFYNDRGQIQFGDIIKISGKALDFLNSLQTGKSIPEETINSEEEVRNSAINLLDKYKYHYQSYLKHPLIYTVDIQQNDKTAEFECAVAFVRDEMTLDEFWQLKNQVVSIPAKQFQKDNKFRKFELQINPTATCLYLYSANAKELGMPYHKILSDKLLEPDGSPCYLHGNVLRFEGKAKECAERYFNSIPSHIGDIKL